MHTQVFGDGLRGKVFRNSRLRGMIGWLISMTSAAETPRGWSGSEAGQPAAIRVTL
jgi:hypothetical protein